MNKLEDTLRQKQIELDETRRKFDLLHDAYSAEREGIEDFQKMLQTNRQLQNENMELKAMITGKRIRPLRNVVVSVPHEDSIGFIEAVKKVSYRHCPRLWQSWYCLRSQKVRTYAEGCKLIEDRLS